MDKKDSFASTYGINSLDYREVQIDSSYFSRRTFGKLRVDGVNTVEDLLKRNETDLLSIKGFGRSCYNEVLNYIKALPKNLIMDNPERIVPRRHPSWAKDNKELLYEGRFYELEREYLEKDKDYIEKMQEAYAVIDKELIDDIKKNSDLLSEYAYSFRAFYLSMENIIKVRKEMKNCLISLTKQKPNKHVYPYVLAYSYDTAIQNRLLSIWSDDKNIFEDLQIYQLRNHEVGLVVLKFLQWCHFDLKNEYLSYLDSQRDRQRIEGVLKLRSQRNTLEEVGSIYGVTRERIRQLESKAVSIFKTWERKHKFLAKIMAECEGISVIQFEQLDELLQEYSDIVIYLLSLADHSEHYYVDFDLEIIVYNDLDYSVRIQKYVDLLPDVFNVGKLSTWMSDLPEKIPDSILYRAIELQYRITGDTYHRSRLSVGAICKHVLKAYYPDGLHIYDEKELPV